MTYRTVTYENIKVYGTWTKIRQKYDHKNMIKYDIYDKTKIFLSASYSQVLFYRKVLQEPKNCVRYIELSVTKCRYKQFFLYGVDCSSFLPYKKYPQHLGVRY